MGSVLEEYRPWTSGSFPADAPSVTVETVISPKGQAIAARMETFARLAADLSNRYDWDALDQPNIRGHREFATTHCPGPYLWSRVDQIVARANQLRTGNKPAPAHSSAGDIESLADAVIRGDYGNGGERKRRLGAQYAAVQKRVNEKLAGKNTAQPVVNIDALADAVIRGDYGNGEERKRRLGANYAAVQARANRKLDIR